MDMILFEVFLKNIHLIPQDQIVYNNIIYNLNSAVIISAVVESSRCSSKTLKTGSCPFGRGEGVGGGYSPCHGREIFQNLCMKLAFSCTLDTIIRGSLCTGIDQFSYGRRFTVCEVQLQRPKPGVEQDLFLPLELYVCLYTLL